MISKPEWFGGIPLQSPSFGANRYNLPRYTFLLSSTESVHYLMYPPSHFWVGQNDPIHFSQQQRIAGLNSIGPPNESENKAFPWRVSFFLGQNHHFWRTYRSFKFKLTISENHLSNPNSTNLLVSSTTAWNPETLKNHLKLGVFSGDSWLRFETSSRTEHWIAIPSTQNDHSQL